MSRVDILLLYKLRDLYKRLDQLTWTVRDSQQRFPMGTPENEDQLVKIYLALALDLEDVLMEIKTLRKQYDKQKS